MKIPIIHNAVNSIHAAAFLLGAASLFSRLLGVLRDRLLAGHFGAGRQLDIYYAAFQLPDFMSTIFLLGAGSAAILPIFQEYLKEDRQKARDLISGLSSFFIFAAIALALLAFFLAPLAVNWIVPGFSYVDRALTAKLIRIMLLSPIFLGLSSILSSVVQSFQRFFAYALAPIFYNLGIIAGILFFVPNFGVKGLAVGVVLGAGMHFLIQLLTVRSLGFGPKIILRTGTAYKGVREVIKLSLPRTLSLSLANVTITVLLALGSTLDAGSIAIFQLAQNLYFVPVGIFGISYAVAIFPRLHRSFLEKDYQKFFSEFFLGIRSVLFWIIPATVLFIVLRAHLVRAIFGTGAFSWQNTRLSAAALAVFALAMFAGSLNNLFIRAFYALENTWLPLVINLVSSALSVIFAFGFTKLLLRPSSGLAVFLASLLNIRDLSPAVLGLTLGFSLGLILDTILLYRSLARLGKKLFGQWRFSDMRPILKMIISALAAGGAAYFVRASFSQTLPLITFWRVLSQGFVAGVAGLAVYGGILWFWGSEELRTFMNALRRRFLRLNVLPEQWDGQSSRLESK